MKQEPLNLNTADNTRNCGTMPDPNRADYELSRRPALAVRLRKGLAEGIAFAQGDLNLTVTPVNPADV